MGCQGGGARNEEFSEPEVKGLGKARKIRREEVEESVMVVAED